MTRTISPLALGYSVLAGPVLWFAHFIALTTLVEFGCRANFNNLSIIAPGTIQIIIIVLTGIALVLVGAGALLSFRRWQTLRDPAKRGLSEHNRHYFLATVGTLLGVLFLFVIVMTVLPTFFLSVCDVPV